jgi:hypothetical protein
VTEDINASEWRNELDRIFASIKPGDEGLTLKEIAKATGAGLGATRVRLVAMAEAGRLIIGRKQFRALDGVMRWSPVYRLKRKAK